MWWWQSRSGWRWKLHMDLRRCVWQLWQSSGGCFQMQTLKCKVCLTGSRGRGGERLEWLLNERTGMAKSVHPKKIFPVNNKHYFSEQSLMTRNTGNQIRECSQSSERGLVIIKVTVYCFNFWFKNLHALNTPWHIIVYPALRSGDTRLAIINLSVRDFWGLSAHVKATSPLRRGPDRSKGSIQTWSVNLSCLLPENNSPSWV